MTEQEAINGLKYLFSEYELNLPGTDSLEILHMAIAALEEIQQYRALGAVEEFSTALENVKTLSSMYEKLSDQEVTEYKILESYKAIGTVEECREAVEKQGAKKPNIWGDGYSNGEMVYDMYDCPNCGKSYELEYQEYDHCSNCGQAIEWSNVS